MCHRSREIAFTIDGVKPMKLKNSEIIATGKYLGCQSEDIEKVISIEEIAYPSIVKEWFKCQG